MPNWCFNDVTIRHTDPAMIARAVRAYQEGRLLSEFFPCPPELHKYDAPNRDEARAARFLEQYGATDWYGWQTQNWGTKWDIGGNGEFIEQPDANTIELRFDSAWSPPVEAYAKLEGFGFEIEAHYNEPGMAFFGSYIDGCEDTIDYSSMTADQIRTEFPELDERFCVSDWLEDSQENLEIDLDGGLSATNEQDQE